jgi:hypothetical protein
MLLLLLAELLCEPRREVTKDDDEAAAVEARRENDDKSSKMPTLLLSIADAAAEAFDVVSLLGASATDAVADALEPDDVTRAFCLAARRLAISASRLFWRRLTGGGTAAAVSCSNCLSWASINAEAEMRETVRSPSGVATDEESVGAGAVAVAALRLFAAVFTAGAPALLLLTDSLLPCALTGTSCSAAAGLIARDGSVCAAISAWRREGPSRPDVLALTDP